LEHTQSGKALAEQAIASANVLLAEKRMRLVLAGQSAKAVSAPNAEDIPVYLVQAPATARATPAAVPNGCRCIFVSPTVFNAFVKEQSTGPARLKLADKYVLVFMLLHEAGHLSKSTVAAEFANGQLTELNIEPSRAKANEEDADEFAADLVRTPMRGNAASNAKMEAILVAMELGNLSWNMQAQRSLDEFGATTVGKPSVFFDKNLTHPNLGWRILRMNYLVHGTSASKSLLDSFEDARRRGANPEPLYVAPQK
jgi:hypothetical protein